jgi:hypothetical protein
LNKKLKKIRNGAEKIETKFVRKNLSERFTKKI